MTRDFRRELRQRQTYAEAKLWMALRSGRLDGLKFRRQYGIDRYIADFACESLMLVIELDGAVHDLDENQLDDLERQQHIETLGWCVLRFRNEQVTDHLHKVLNAIRDQARLAGAATPHPPTDFVGGPLPLPLGEG